MKRFGTFIRLQGRTNMVGQVSLTVIIIVMNFEHASGENLWCYECNTDLRDGHTRECNDPYASAPHFDLILCPRNESQQCLKSVIDYGDVLVTVRGCVPSREIGGYCQPEDYFPGSSIVCSFCQEYACNGHESTSSFVLHNIVLLLASSSATLF